MNNNSTIKRFLFALFALIAVSSLVFLQCQQSGDKVNCPSGDEPGRVRENPAQPLRLSSGFVVGEILIPVKSLAFKYTAVKGITSGGVGGIAILYSDSTTVNHQDDENNTMLVVPVKIARSELGNPTVGTKLRVMCLNERQGTITGSVLSFFKDKLAEFGQTKTCCDIEGNFITSDWNARNPHFQIETPLLHRTSNRVFPKKPTAS